VRSPSTTRAISAGTTNLRRPREALAAIPVWRSTRWENREEGSAAAPARGCGWSPGKADQPLRSGRRWPRRERRRVGVPYCLIMFDDAIKYNNLDDSVRRKTSRNWWRSRCDGALNRSAPGITRRVAARQLSFSLPTFLLSYNEPCRNRRIRKPRERRTAHGLPNRDPPLDTAEETLKSWVSSLRGFTPIVRPWPQLRGAAAGRLRRPYPKPETLFRILGTMPILFQPGPEDLRDALRDYLPIHPRNGRFPRPAQAGA